MRILFISRGRGHGHAIPDMALAQHLANHDVFFASYATGLATLRKKHPHTTDLGITTESPNFIDTITPCRKAIFALQPDVVISHEEAGAILAANLQNVPSIYIAEWLPPAQTTMHDAIKLANKAVIWCDPGIFPALPNTEFVGPLVRLSPPIIGRRGSEKKTVTVITGGYATEARTPIADVLLEATRRVGAIVQWVGAGHSVERKAAIYTHALFLPFQEKIEDVLLDSDLVVTVGNRNTTSEAAYLGVPTLCLSPQTNPIDDMMTQRLRSNTWLPLKAVTPDVLAWWIEKLLSDPPPTRVSEPTVAKIAGRIEEVAQSFCRV